GMAWMRADRTFHGRRRYVGAKTRSQNTSFAPRGRGGPGRPWAAALRACASRSRKCSELLRNHREPRRAFAFRSTSGLRRRGGVGQAVLGGQGDRLVEGPDRRRVHVL